MVVAKGLGEGKVGAVFNGDRVSDLQDKDSSGGGWPCRLPTMSVPVMLPNCALRNGYDDRFCLFCHN